MNKLLTTVFALAVASVTAFSVQPRKSRVTPRPVKRRSPCASAATASWGYQASFPEVYKVPKISGQSAKYIASSLAAYKKGDRKHPTMRGIADSAERPGHGRRRRLL
jgi:cytochrome c553